jgi:hypothetical protein
MRTGGTEWRFPVLVPSFANEQLELGLSIAGVIVIVGGAAFSTWERHDMAKSIVQGQLGRVHATRVELSYDWTSSDRDSVTYDVVFFTPDGQRHSNRCKVSIQESSRDGVYWEHPLPQLKGPQR